MGICCSKTKILQKCDINISTFKVTAKLSSAMEKCIFQLVSKEELIILRELYIDLSRRTDSNQNIDIETFIQFFSLPVLII